MPRRASSLQNNTDVLVSREIGSQYDTVKIVADYMSDVMALADMFPIIEDLQTRIERIDSRFFQQAEEPSGELVSVGDLWMDTQSSVLKFYREYESGQYRWEPFQYADNDIVNGGYF